MGRNEVILLDTHVLIWLDEGSSRLGQQARKLIDQAYQNQQLAVSSISFWEVAMLVNKQRIELAMDVLHWRNSLLANGLLEIPVNGDIGIYSAQLPDFHGDPADRMIVSTALQKGTMLLTADRKIIAYPSQVRIIDASL